MILRLVLVLAWTLPCMLVQAALLCVRGNAKVKFAQIYWRGVAFIMGLHLHVKGAVTSERPVVFIANHCTWIDIIALGSVLPGCFVAKGDIANWPFISWVAKLGRTIFVSRSKATLGQEREGLSARLAAGDNIILFPEGTTSDGVRILPFQSSFLVIANSAAKPVVQPVTIVYDRLDGLPVQRRDRPVISWYGDMDMASHYPGIGRRKSLGATLILDPAIPAGTFENRKALSAALEARLAANAARLRQGLGVDPASVNP
ncbi:MAG TPA: lysophospholipid acyltransferase family protein [Acidocella sp.]|nr:lysophospholipid acyltransferase family protein [Acidocella sp.]